MLVHLGKPELPHAVLLGYHRRRGGPMLVRRRAGRVPGDVHDEEYVNAALEFFLATYRVHKLDFTYVYAGVAEALAAIREAWPGIAMAVLTQQARRIRRARYARTSGWTASSSVSTAATASIPRSRTPRDF